ncbi:MAG: hypothetical protein U5J83_17645 [Bryobacterales bacterium]|nr:hypothetical protein [Bryobacterales bacterium]
MTNPDLEVRARDAEWKVKESEAKARNLKVELDTKRLDLEANLAKLRNRNWYRRSARASDDDALAEAGPGRRDRS